MRLKIYNFFSTSVLVMNVFSPNDSVNCYNCRYWADSNSHIPHEVHTLLPQKLNVWAGTFGVRIVDQNYPEAQFIFQQLGSPPHYVMPFRQYLDHHLQGHWIG